MSRGRCDAERWTTCWRSCRIKDAHLGLFVQACFQEGSAPSARTSGGRIEQALRQLAADPFAPALHTYKLKGQLAGAWACTAGYDCRIVFEFVLNSESGEEEILLIDVGTHDEVY